MLLDLLAPAPPAAVAAALFGHGSGGGLLLRLLSSEGVGCTAMAAGAWAPGAGGAHARCVTYTKPLSRRQRLLLPLGPAAVPCSEEQRLAAGADAGAAGAVLVTSRVTSSGVPFADCFANHLEWRLEPADDAGGTTRLRLAARCTFHRPVLGPLRGQIEGESLQARGLPWLRLVFACCPAAAPAPASAH